MTGQRPRIALLAAAAVLGTACGQDQDSAQRGEGPRSALEATRVEPDAGEGDRLERAGVAIVLPAGWDGRVLALNHASAVLQAANFELPPGQVELPLGEEDPVKTMTDEQAFVEILPCGVVSCEEATRSAPEVISLAELTFLPAGHPRIPRGHAFARGSFEFGMRCLLIEADFGSTRPPQRLTEKVNEVLASLSVAERKAAS